MKPSFAANSFSLQLNDDGMDFSYKPNVYAFSILASKSLQIDAGEMKTVNDIKNLAFLPDKQ